MNSNCDKIMEKKNSPRQVLWMYGGLTLLVDNNTWLYEQHATTFSLVQDDIKLLDDGGEIPKSQGRVWRFTSRL